MQFNRRHISLGLIALCAASAIPAYAHSEKASVTDISWSHDDGYLYVTHKFHLHQTEVSLFKAGITHSAKFESLRARAELALYVEKNFTLQYRNEDPLILEILGAEIEGRDVYVYQQAKLNSAPDGLIVTSNLLRDIIPGQINHVDVKLDGATRSLAFRGNDGPKKAFYKRD